MSTGPQTLSFFTLLTITNGFLVILGSKTIKNVQIDPQTTKMTEKAKRPVSEGMSLLHISNYREAELLKI